STFVIAGSGEAPEDRKTYGERTIRIGERSPDAIREKAQWALGEMERRMGGSRRNVGRFNGNASLHGLRRSLHHGGRNRQPRSRKRGLTWQFRAHGNRVDLIGPQPNLPWQCLNFLPEPHGHSSLRPTLPQLEGSFGLRSACASFPLPTKAGARAGAISSSPVVGSTLCASM